jgi:small-conductance mechanosensitive channel
MRDATTTAFLLLGLTLALLVGPGRPGWTQTTGKDVGQKAAETGEAIRDYSVERKDEAVAHAKRLVADLDARIKELETRVARATGEAKAKAQAQLKELRAKRAEASRKLDELGRAGRGSWDRAKEGFANAYRDLATAYDRAAAEFKK